jgi:hypothetical protein
MPREPGLEETLRDVLVLFRRHPREQLSADDVVMRAGCPREHVTVLLPALVQGFVLTDDEQSGMYRFDGDVCLGYEIDAFVRRIDSLRAFQRNNVAKFRDRYGS